MHSDFRLRQRCSHRIDERRGLRNCILLKSLSVLFSDLGGSNTPCCGVRRSIDRGAPPIDLGA